jgi:hypothetical protein
MPIIRKDRLALGVRSIMLIIKNKNVVARNPKCGKIKIYKHNNPNNMMNISG